MEMALCRILPAIILLNVLAFCSGACTFPSGLRGDFISSAKSALYFEDSVMVGYVVDTFATGNFSCEESSGTQYMVQSDTFNKLGLDFRAYMCMDFTNVTSDELLYYYYLASPEESDANNERVVFLLTSLGTAAFADVCTIGTNSYSSLSYSLLMKNDSIDSVKTKCPIPFLGDFSYSYDTGSGNLCNDSSVAVCTGNKDTMTWNYTQCSQIQAYSASGVLYCVYSSNVSDVYTLHVYNTDATTDESTTYRFTCYRVSGYETVYATQYPKDCPTTMNTTYVPSPGAVLALNASQTCAYDTVSDDETLSAGAIAAIVICCLLIIALIIAGILYYLYHRRKKQKEAEYEAAQRKVDPDELSPNMRLGLPNESKYDLDRLMYSPELNKNGNIKRSQRKDMAILEGLEGYNEGEKYMDEDQRQTALESHLFMEKRKRKDGKNEFDADKPTNKQFLGRVKDMAKGKRRPLRAAALAKLRLKPKARPMAYTPSESGRVTQSKDIVIQVEEADGEGKRKTRFADEEPQSDRKTPQDKKEKKLEEIETLSDIADNEMGVDDLSDDNKEPRLILPNLNPKKKEKRKKRPKGPPSVEVAQPKPGMPHNTRFMPPRAKSIINEPEFIEPAPLHRGNPTRSSLPPLARIHRKDNPKAWKEAFGDMNGIESMDLETLKKQLPENRWKKLLEELYRDKKYFDYVKKSTSNTENDLFSSADESLQYLYGRALFWETQQPIPARPPTNVKRMYSRYESNKTKSGANTRNNTAMVRSSTTRSSRRQVPRTPSTQVSRLKKRENMDKKNKNEANEKEVNNVPNGLPPALLFFEGGTQTDFSPVPPLTPVMITDDKLVEEIDITSLPGSAKLDRHFDTPVQPSFLKEVTKSDIKLEEFEEEFDQQYDAEFVEDGRGTSTMAV